MIRYCPIRVKFVIFNVNAVEIRSSQQNVAFRTVELLLYWKMRNFDWNSRSSLHKKITNWTSNRIVIVKRKYIFEVDKPPHQPSDLSTDAIF